MASLALALAACLAGTPLTAQRQQDPSPHSDAQLVAELAAIRPEQAFTVALRLTMDTGWHSYWRNPGDAGGETVIEWNLPEGFTAGEIQWPHPRRIEAPPLASYGYDDEVLLLVEVHPRGGDRRGDCRRRGKRGDDAALWVFGEVQELAGAALR
jgi:thiol:disulfide interchange protein DsbD